MSIHPRSKSRVPDAVQELATLLGAQTPSRTSHGFGLTGGEWTVEPSFTGYTDPAPGAAYCFGKRSSCLRDDDGRMSCAEVEIVKRLRAAGWTGGWVNTYGGDPPLRWLDCMTTPAAIGKGLPPRREALAKWLRVAGVAAGSPDIFVVRGNDLLAIECKRRGAPGAWSDSVRATQTAWVGEVITARRLLEPDELVVVWWSREAAPSEAPTLPPEREPTRKYPDGRPPDATAQLGAIPRGGTRAVADSGSRQVTLGRRVTMTQIEPTAADRQAALDAVTERGWSRTNAAGHPWRPNGWRGADGDYVPCEQCGARTNPARWPLFFTGGPEAGRTVWTCSTCKLKQADRLGVAKVLVDIPLI